MKGVCLVTGGAGFIGCALSHRLVERFDQVVVVDSLLEQVHPHRTRPDDLHPSVKLIVGDVADRAVWDDLLVDFKPDTIIHLAAETGTGQSLTEATRHARSNVVGTSEMLDAIVRKAIVPERLVLSSSRAVYGEGAWRSRSTGELTYPGLRTKANLEAHIWDFPGLEGVAFEASKIFPHPTNVYASTKLAQEHVLQSWCSAFGSELYILRFQNVFGPGQSLHNPYTGIVQIFSQIAREGRPIPVYEDGRIVRDFVVVDDVVDAVTICATGGGASGIYDIGSGRQTTIQELAKLVAAHYGAPDPIVTSQFRYGDVRHAACDISRTTSKLGWQPRYTLEDGLARLWQWIDGQLSN
jgi:dTDP-L-rhamnose 4-epimerase